MKMKYPMHGQSSGIPGTKSGEKYMPYYTGNTKRSVSGVGPKGISRKPDKRMGNYGLPNNIAAMKKPTGCSDGRRIGNHTWSRI